MASSNALVSESDMEALLSSEIRSQLYSAGPNRSSEFHNPLYKFSKAVECKKKKSSEDGKSNLRLKDFLASISSFSEFTDQQLLTLEQKATIKRYAPDHIVFKQGDDGDKFYVLLKGQVAVEKAHVIQNSHYDPSSTNEKKLIAFMQGLLDNYDNVYWNKIPYKSNVKEYLHSFFHNTGMHKSNRSTKNLAFDKIEEEGDEVVHEEGGISKTIQSHPIPKRLQFNLQKLMPVYDFSKIILVN